MIGGLEIRYAVGDKDDELAVQRMAIAFERLGADFERFGDVVFPRLVPLFEGETSRQFEGEGGGPNRGSWEALSPAYGEWKRSVAPGKPILEFSGKLREALTQSSSPLAVRSMGGQEFDFGTRGVEYASFHQTGTSRMPSRPPFDFSANFERDFQRIGNEAVRDMVKQSGAAEFGEVSE